jgi:hypothetical protein
MIQLKRVLTITILILLIGSCGDSSLFDPFSTEEGSITLRTINSGTVLREGEDIPLDLQFDTNEVLPESMTIELLNAGEELLLSSTITELYEPLPSLLFEDLEPGKYILQFRIYDAQGIIKEERVDFFFIGDLYYSIRGVTTIPPFTLPGGASLVRADLRIPPGADPWLRWHLDDFILGEGYFSQGLDEIQIHAPSSVGMYSLRLELFPFGPLRGESFVFDSQIQYRGSLIVSEDQVGAYDLSPDESYYSIFHFLGTIEDSSPFGSNRNVLILGNPTLEASGDTFGYYLNGNSGFLIEENLLPVRMGELSPFSLSLRIVPREINGNALLFAVEPDVFHLRLGIGGSLSVWLGEVESSVEDFFTVPEEAVSLTLSVVPGNETIFLWFRNGELLKTDKVKGVPFVAEGEVSSRIGGEGGFKGLIDEFGIFFKDQSGRNSIDPGVFERSMVEMYGKDLILAEGFDGLYLPAKNITFSGDAVKTGESTVSLGSASALSFDLGEPVERTILGEIRWGGNPANLRMEVFTGNNLLFSIEGERGLLIEGNWYGINLGEGEINFSLRADGSGYLLSLDEKVYKIHGAGSHGYTVHISNSGYSDGSSGAGEGAISISDILFRYDSPRIVQEETEEESEES